jgi:hypothetical protein
MEGPRMKFFLALLLLATPLAALEYWILGAVSGFRLGEKLSPKWKRALRLYGLLALLSGGAAVTAGSMRGCGGVQLAPQIADTSSQWRELPQLTYVKPDADDIQPTPAVPPVAENTSTWTVGSGTVATATTTATIMTSTGSEIHLTNPAGAYAISITTDAQGNQVETIVDAASGQVIMQSTGAGGMSVADKHVAKMQSYPASQRPSHCIASCMSHHRSWVTPVEDSYCEKDTSNADGGFYGWVKQDAAWIPVMWPPTEQSDERAPELIHLKPGEQASLTEGKRSY